MKSLIEEASTITKAVEKAWVRAGKPVEFTIKVFEEPKYNFLGMTTKSAKVAIFFKSTDFEASTPHDKKEARSTHKELPTKQKSPRPSQDQHNNRTPHYKNYNAEPRDEYSKRSPAARPIKDDRQNTRDYAKNAEHPREQRPQTSEYKTRYEPRETREDQNNGPLKNKEPRERRSFRDRKDRPEPVWSNEMADIAQDWLENMLTMLDKREHLVQAKVVGPHLKFEFKAPLIADREKEKILFISWAHLILATVGNKYKKDLRGLKIILSNAE